MNIVYLFRKTGDLVPFVIVLTVSVTALVMFGCSEKEGTLAARYKRQLKGAKNVSEKVPLISPSAVGLKNDFKTGVYYKVRKGDSVTAIASRYSVSPSSVIAQNRLGGGGLIEVGQMLFIPFAEIAKTETDPFLVREVRGS